MKLMNHLLYTVSNLEVIACSFSRLVLCKEEKHNCKYSYSISDMLHFVVTATLAGKPGKSSLSYNANCDLKCEFYIRKTSPHNKKNSLVRLNTGSLKLPI